MRSRCKFLDIKVSPEYHSFILQNCGARHCQSSNFIAQMVLYLMRKKCGWHRRTHVLLFRWVWDSLGLARPSLPYREWRQMNEVRGGEGRQEIRCRTQAMLGDSMPTLPDKNSMSREALDASALAIYRHHDSHAFTWAGLSFLVGDLWLLQCIQSVPSSDWKHIFLAFSDLWNTTTLPFDLESSENVIAMYAWGEEIKEKAEKSILSWFSADPWHSL